MSRGGVSLREKKDRLRHHLFEIQRGICCLCCKPMTLDRGLGKAPPKNYASFEHVHPRGKGGKNRGNVVLSCRQCNTRRAQRPLTYAEAMRVDHILLVHRQQLAGRSPHTLGESWPNAPPRVCAPRNNAGG